MKIRVHELARELGVDSRQVLDTLAQAGEFVKSASSRLEPAVAAAVRDALTSSSDQSTRSSSFTSGIADRQPSPKSYRRAPSRGRQWDDDDYGCDSRADAEKLTSAQAAHELGVRQSTIRQWSRRGYLTPSGTRGRALLYSRGDLRHAQARARSKTRHPPLPAPVRRELIRRPVSTNEAAEIAGVATSTIRMWVHRGLLHPLPTAVRAHTFDPIEVLRIARRH